MSEIDAAGKPLALAVGKAVALLSTLRYAPVCPPEQIAKSWLAVLGPKRATPDEVKAVAVRLLAETKEFPVPAEILATLREIRAENRASAFRRLVECVDGDGRPVFAAPERVRGGRLLPAGDRSGDGSSAPQLPAPLPRDEVRARMHEMLGWEAPGA